MGLLIYIVVLLLLGGYAIFYLEFASMQLFLIALIFPVFMIIFLQLLRRKLYVEIEIRSLLVEKEKLFSPGQIVISVTAENMSSFLPLLKGVVFVEYKNGFSGEKGKKKLYFSVDATERKKQELYLDVKTVGDVCVSVEKIKIYDYLSIFSRKLMKKQPGEHILVLPPKKEMYVEADHYMSESMGETDKFSPYKKGEDPSEIFDIREFKNGDKYQRIHWKLSFKKQTLMVKDYSLPLADAVLIFVDFSMTETGKDRERMLEILTRGIYSVSFALFEQELPQKFIWYDGLAGAIREEKAAKEEDLYFLFQEMFQTKISADSGQLANSYAVWNDSKPVESGIYLTVNTDSRIDGKELGVRNLRVINLKEDFVHEQGTTDDRGKRVAK